MNEHDRASRAKSKRLRYEEKVRERLAKKRAMIEKEVDSMLSGTPTERVKIGSKVWQKIGVVEDALELKRAIKDYDL